jgi:hypothetical protein
LVLNFVVVKKKYNKSNSNSPLFGRVFKKSNENA